MRKKTFFWFFFSPEEFVVLNNFLFFSAMSSSIVIEVSLLVLLLLCVICGIKIATKLKKQKAPIFLKVAAFYILLIATQLLLGQYELFCMPQAKSLKARIANISAYIFIVFEFVTFCYLLYTAIRSTQLKKILIGLAIIFPISAFLIWINEDSFMLVMSIANPLETIVLIPFCLVYFIEILKRPPIFQLTSQPSFWIVTGIFFLLVTITPLYLLLKYFDNIPEMQIVDHVAYDLIVLLFTKSILISNSAYAK